MKHVYALLLITMLSALQYSYAAETEPNNTVAQANTLALNGSNTGKINTGGDIDWWSVTTNADGKLNITLTPAGKKVWVYLYDNNGTTLLASHDSVAVFTQSLDGLAAGTYYIKVAADLVTDTVSYTISNTLTTIAQANDAEPNNNKLQALLLSNTIRKTGHVGYYYNTKRDTADWYKIVTTVDQKITLKLQSANSQNLAVTLFAGNGISVIGTAAGTGLVTLSVDGTHKDSFFVKVNAKVITGFAPYTLYDSLSVKQTDSILLPLNYSLPDSITRPGAADWWRVTTNADGKLNLTLTPLSGKNLYLYLYDKDKTTLLNSAQSSTSFSFSYDGLAAGTYFLKVVPYYPTDTSRYILANSLTQPAKANDTEPNNTLAKALVLNPNSTKTGHVGFYYNHYRDTADWYKVTTTAEGLLKLTLTPANGQNLYLYLYDNDGTTLLNSAQSGTSFTFSTDGLAVGTYYLKVIPYYNTGFTSYTLTDSLLTISQPNDIEPNNSAAQALTLPLNGTTTGHLGYYYNHYRDSADWYKVTTNADGQLQLSITPTNGSNVWIYLYDNDGTTLLNSNQSYTKFTVSQDGLAAGTYYVKVNTYYSSAFTPYILSDSLLTISQPNDVEPNNSKAQALTLALNSTTTGHAGYYYNHYRDSSDWYKVTTNADGLLQLAITPTNGSNVWIYLYDNDGTTLLNSNQSYSKFTVNTDGLAAGTYYIKVNTYYNTAFTPYVLTDSLIKVSQANDAEPNNSAAQALTLALNGTTTGHTGYYYNHFRDSSDWYKVTTNADGLLKLSITPVNGSNMWIYLYDKDGTTLLNSYQSSTKFTINTDGLAAGTYYIKVNTYYNTVYTPYILTDSLKTYSLANDIEPNKKPYQGGVIPANGTVTGHTNFYYNNSKDSVDWWKLNYTGGGPLQFTFTQAPRLIDGNTPNVWFYVYKDTLAAPVYSSYFSGPSNVISLTGLAKATYYIRINPYYTSDYDVYSISNSFTPTALQGNNPTQLKGITENEKTVNGPDISIYPNPTSSVIHITQRDKNANPSLVLLTDANGHQVWSSRQVKGQLSFGGGLEINVSHLPAGIYLLQITDTHNNTVTKKIVIAR